MAWMEPVGDCCYPIAVFAKTQFVKLPPTPVQRVGGEGGGWAGLFHFFDPFVTNSKVDLNF